MATLTTFYTPDSNGTAITFAACGSTSDTFANDGKVLVLLRDAAAAGVTTATVTAPGKFKGETITTPISAAVAANGHVVLGPFPPEIFNSSAGLVVITWGGATPATNGQIALLRIP